MKIIGIGNALLDVLLRLDSDETLTEMGIKKGAMDLIDESKMIEIQKAQSGLQRTEAPGGSVCNTMRTLARLGAEAGLLNRAMVSHRAVTRGNGVKNGPSDTEVRTANDRIAAFDVGYIGKVGNDRIAAFYVEETIKAGVTPFFVRTEGISGCSTVLISPDGERTMATFLGPAATLTDDEVAGEILQQYDCLYLEGYLISNEKLFLPVLKRAKSMGLKVALDLSNFNIVNGFRDFLKEVIPAYVDILFSNESEACAYTGLPAIEAIDVIAQDVEISVVTVGKDGVWAKQGDRKVQDVAISNNVVDTTGAGDNFAAGFLFGYALDATLEQSVRIGSLLSGNVIETVGAQIPDERWSQIMLNFEGIRKK